ncbi:MAG TPA: NINE protein [Candidatus Angelobacter sp.]|nr:NINE protein [Candidatus Angelobacter sp.]
MSDATTCPYCRMSFEQEGLVKIYCPGCGMPHHEDCYQENGGCTVFGCPRAPADDPKLQVSQAEVNASFPATPQYAAAQPVMYGQPQFGSLMSAQPAALAMHPPRSRTAFIVLGIFLGAFGAHNFYAGYTGKAVGQLCLTVLSFFYLAVASWIWAVIEICIIEKDSAGIRFN